MIRFALTLASVAALLVAGGGLAPDNGKTYLFRIRKGAYFSPDPAFKGAKRELTAEDVAYSIKRHMDPKNRSYWQWLVDGKIVGLDELAQKARAGATGLD